MIEVAARTIGRRCWRRWVLRFMAAMRSRGWPNDSLFKNPVQLGLHRGQHLIRLTLFQDLASSTRLESIGATPCLIHRSKDVSPWFAG